MGEVFPPPRPGIGLSLSPLRHDGNARPTLPLVAEICNMWGGVRAVSVDWGLCVWKEDYKVRFVHFLNALRG